LDEADYGGESSQLSNEQSLTRDKEWFTQTFSERVRGSIAYYESELETIRNKKKGGSKKNKEKVNQITR
jgi:hypothetical protein